MTSVYRPTVSYMQFTTSITCHMIPSTSMHIIRYLSKAPKNPVCTSMLAGYAGNGCDFPSSPAVSAVKSVLVSFPVSCDAVGDLGGGSRELRTAAFVLKEFLLVLAALVLVMSLYEESRIEDTVRS